MGILITSLQFILWALAINIVFSWVEKRRIRTIIVTEDNAIELSVLKSRINFRGANVIYYDNCEDVIDEIGWKTVDLVLVDMYLKGKTTGDKLFKFCVKNKIPSHIVTGATGGIKNVDDKFVIHKTHDNDHYARIQALVDSVMA